MMDEVRTFGEAMEAVAAGRRDAATPDLEAYFRRLRAFAYKRLKEGVDPEDVVMSAVVSFLQARPDRGIDLASEGAGWKELISYVLRHCNKWNKRMYRHPPAALQGEVSDEGLPPDEVAALKEEADFLRRVLAEVLESIPDPGDRGIIERHAQGLSQREIAGELRVPRYAVERAVEHFREQVRRRVGHPVQP
jgi:RNA polymerase sigma factor (sigma-70 family)